MDYESDVNDAEKNTTFKRQIFVKSQWDKMIGNLKGKSYLTTIQRGYKTEPEFYSTNPYLTGSNKEEMYNFINALNDFLR
jgi:hypothetical protein